MDVPGWLWLATVGVLAGVIILDLVLVDSSGEGHVWQQADQHLTQLDLSALLRQPVVDGVVVAFVTDKDVITKLATCRPVHHPRLDRKFILG